MPWPKGVSGNPAGSLKAADRGFTPKQLMSEARAATPRLIKRLIYLSERGKTEAIQLAAIGMLLDRGFGRPATPTDIQALRDDLRRNARAILLGEGPRASEKLADFKRRWEAVESATPRVINMAPLAAEQGEASP